MRNSKYFLAAILLAIGATAATAQSVNVTATYGGSISVPGIHTLVGFHTTGNYPTGVFVLGFDAASVPSSGTLSSPPAGCFYAEPTVSPALATTLGMTNAPVAVPVQTGLVVVLSSTGCNVYTPVSGYLSAIFQ